MPGLGGHAFEGFFIHFIAPARFVGDGQIAALRHDGVAFDEVFAGRFVVRVVFQDDEVRGAGGKVNVHQRGQRAERVVRRHFDIVRFGNGRDLLLLEESTGQTSALIGTICRLGLCTGSDLDLVISSYRRTVDVPNV